MILTIKANGKINKVKVEKTKKNIDGIKINFDTCYAWSDLELWLEDNNGKYLDYARFNVSKRNKIKVTKCNN